MSNVSRRKVLGLLTATAGVAVAGCADEDEQTTLQSNVITDGAREDTGCVEDIETSGYEEGFLFEADAVDLTIGLIDGHGFGKAVAEWEVGGIDDSEYEQTMRTIEQGEGAITFEIVGPPTYVHLTVGCEGEGETDLIVELTEDENEDTDGETDD